MTKRQLIDRIIDENSTADPGFLAGFEQDELDAYLRHLRQARLPRLAGDPHRFDHYFENAPTVHWRPATGQTVAIAEPDDLLETQDPQGRYVETAGVSDDTSVSDEGLYVSEDSATSYDVPAAAEDLSSDEAAADASEDALDLSYVPAGRTARSDPQTDKQQSDSSFAETQEDAEAWLF